MEEKEARQVLRIMMTADGGCSHCAFDLMKKFLEVWPEHKAVAKEIWDEFDYYDPYDWNWEEDNGKQNDSQG